MVGQNKAECRNFRAAHRNLIWVFRCSVKGKHKAVSDVTGFYHSFPLAFWSYGKNIILFSPPKQTNWHLMFVYMIQLMLIVLKIKNKNRIWQNFALVGQHRSWYYSMTNALWFYGLAMNISIPKSRTSPDLLFTELISTCEQDLVKKSSGIQIPHEFFHNYQQMSPNISRKNIYISFYSDTWMIRKAYFSIKKICW